MDTYVKGFSFMPATNINLNDNLNYIECGELEQTWKTARRERIKQRDEKIWEQFVQEQDVVNIICNDDPYTFLEQLPESCLKELMEKEYLKTKQEIEEEIHVEIEEELEDTPADHDNQCIITAVSVDSDKNNVDYQIFDDKEDDMSNEGAEEVSESMESPPCTVREVTEEKPVSPPSRPNSGKSAENVSSVIENTIYCAKIKELRNKINDDLMSTISYLEQSVIVNVDTRDVEKLSKRSAEFCTRFNRVHLYQLQRQVHDARRHGGGGVGPRHTAARAQLARLLSLHQSSLQAVQVFGKFVAVSGWWGEAGALDDVVSVLRDVAAAELYAGTKLTFEESQDLGAMCDKLSAVGGGYCARVADYVRSMIEFQSSSRAKRTNKLNTKKKLTNWKNKTPTVDARLSMYSLDKSRKPPPTYRSALGGTSKSRINATPSDAEKKSPKEPPAKLGRPQRERRGRPPTELHTLVEAVAPSTPSHMSREESPRRLPTPRIEHTVPPLNIAPKSPTTPKSNRNTPRQETPSRKVKSNEVNDTARPKSRRTQHVAERDLSKGGQVMEDTASIVDETKRHGNTVCDGTSDDVSKLLRELCGGDGLSFKNDRVESPKNVQLVCVKSSNPQQPSTPQLLRILEETIQKKSPRQIPKLKSPVNDAESYRMTLNIPDDASEKLFQYRTKFVQHMLTSSLYANSDVGKPWEMIASISEQIIKELLLDCVNEMEVHNFIENLYKSELC